MSAADMIMGLDTPKLEVPEKFEPTLPARGWMINPFGGNPAWTLFVAPLPALLACILIFMDQQITAVIINRKEHKLKVRNFEVHFVKKHNVIFINIVALKLHLFHELTERMRLPFRFVCTGHTNHVMFSDGHSMVCCRDSAVYESCQFIKNGIRVRSPR